VPDFGQIAPQERNIFKTVVLGLLYGKRLHT